jgi:cellulose synthase/poly-beta-1,6-N-acetylglucosamine synthase-like glycosyltransferase
MDLAFKLNEKGWKVEQSFFPIKTYVPDTLWNWFKQKLRWSGGGFQAFLTHFKVWIKNPIHVIFLFLYLIFMVSVMFTIGKNIVLWEGIIEYFNLMKESVPISTSFKLTSLIYGSYLLKDFLLALGFTAFSIPYIIPLISGIHNVYKVLLVVPFSMIYLPIFSVACFCGGFFFFYRMRQLSRNTRAW